MAEVLRTRGTDECVAGSHACDRNFAVPEVRDSLLHNFGCLRTYASLINIHLQTAQYLDMFNNGKISAITVSTLRSIDRSIDNVEMQFRTVWNVAAELALLATKQCLWSQPLTGMPTVSIKNLGICF